MEDKIALTELVDLLAAQTELSKQEAEDFLKSFFQTIENGLSSDELVKIKDFGTFKLTPIKARESVDVNTGEKIEIPAHNRVSFSPATALKELVNRPFAHFETVLLHDDTSIPGVETEFEEDESEFEVPKATNFALSTQPEKEKTQDEEPILGKIETATIEPTSAKLRQREKRGREILIPILGGIAIALAGFFLYLGEQSDKKK